MKVIGIGKLSLKNLYPFCVSIFYVSRNYVLEVIKNQQQLIHWERHPLFITFIAFLGHSLIGIPFCISYFLNKRQDDDNRISTGSNQVIRTSRMTFIPSHNAKVSIFALSPFILLVTILDGGTHSTDGYLYVHTCQNNMYLSYEVRILNLFFMSLFSIYMLKYQVHKHQILAFILVALGITLFTTSSYIEKSQNNNCSSLSSSQTLHLSLIILLYAVDSIGFSFKEVLEKWLMEVKRIKYVKLGFILGIVGATCFFILLFILSFIYVKLEDTEDNNPFHDNLFLSFSYVFQDWKVTLLFLLYLILSFLFNFFATITKAFFNPAQMAIANSFSLLLSLLIGYLLPGNKHTYLLALYIPGFIIIMLGCLIYNEIVIIYCCKLQDNTVEEIQKRSQIEITNLLLGIMPENDFDDST